MTTRSAQNTLAIMIWSLMALIATEQAMAQVAQGCKPASQRVGDQMGCWIFAHEGLGQLPQTPLFWHLSTYATRAEAQAAKGPRGTVIEALEMFCLMTRGPP